MGVQAGADGIIVSNHGGRQLDFAPAALDALPGIAAAVGKRVPVLMDGGIRRGTDIIKVGNQFSNLTVSLPRRRQCYMPCLPDYAYTLYSCEMRICMVSAILTSLTATRRP